MAPEPSIWILLQNEYINLGLETSSWIWALTALSAESKMLDFVRSLRPCTDFRYYDNAKEAIYDMVDVTTNSRLKQANHK